MIDKEEVIKSETGYLEKVFEKYMTRDDAMRITFHLLNIMRVLNT